MKLKEWFLVMSVPVIFLVFIVAGALDKLKSQEDVMQEYSYEGYSDGATSYVSRVVAMPYEPKFAVVNGMVAFKVAGTSQLAILTNFGRVSNAPLFSGGYEFIGNDMVAYHTHDGGIGYVTMQNIWKGTTKVPPVFWVVIQPK